MAQLIGIREFFATQQCMTDLFGAVCTTKPGLCVAVIASLMGYNPDNLNLTRLPLYFSYMPAGALLIYGCCCGRYQGSRREVARLASQADVEWHMQEQKYN